jgi:murein DD-endopeptidase MepM/ murein hydrolase activator NlpD
MAAGIDEDSERGGRLWGRRAIARGVLSGVLLAVGVSCTSSPDPAPVMWRRANAPVMTDSLLLKPVDRGRLSSVYGVRYNPVSKRRQVHRGIDWAAPRGTAIRAAGDGVVIVVGRRSGYGNYVRIDHGGTIETAYAHLGRYASGMSSGRMVRQGDLIGKVGSSGRATGPHLHYEVLVAGRQIDPLAFAAPNVAQAVEPAGLEGELGIGGPDLAADDLATEPEPPAPEETPQAPLDTIDRSSIIWVKDLLARPGT